MLCRCIRRTSLALAAAFAAGCFGQSLPPDLEDAGYGTPPDLQPLCTGNNDGVIQANEIVFPIGFSVRYLVNPQNTTVTVAPDGAQGPDGLEWDLTSTMGEVHALTIESLDGKWFAQAFPNATYATVSDLATGTLGVFRATPDALELLGFASETPNETLLVYDAPVATLKFPLSLGTSWVTGARITNGTLEGRPFASTDTYQIEIDARGEAVLPFIKLPNTLRVHVQLTQTIPGGVGVTRIQHLFFHECYGEIGRMVSNPGETNPSFTTAAEFRRLAL